MQSIIAAFDFFFTVSDKTSMNALKHVCFHVQVFLEDRYLEVELLGHRICTSLVLSDNTKLIVSMYTLTTNVWYLSLFHISQALYWFFSVHHLDALPYVKNIFIFNLLFNLLFFSLLHGLSAVAREGYSTLQCTGFIAVVSLRSLAQALGSQASAAEAHRLSCPAACGVLPDQGSNLCP